MKNDLPCFALLLAISLLSGCGSSSHKLILKGQKALDEGQWQIAATAFEQAAQRVTPDPALYYNLATARYALGEYKPALSAIASGLDLDPANTRLLKLKAAVAYRSGDWTLAREALNDAIKSGASEPYVLNARATIERMDKNVDLARLHLLAALRKDPAYPTTLFNLASLYQDHYFTGGAFSLLPDARDLFGMFGSIKDLPEKQRADAAMRFANINARLTKEEGPRQNRNSARSAQLMAEAARYAAERNWSRAESAYSDARNADPLSLDAHLALAKFYESRNNAPAAYRAYVDAAKLPNAKADVLEKAVTLAIAQKRYDVAAEVASKGMARAPGNPTFYYQMAVIRDAEKRPRDARAFAKYYVQLVPDSPFARQVDAWANTLAQ